MIAVDTNVLARVLLQDDDAQTPQAQAFFLWAVENGGLFIPAFVWLEIIWVLKRKGIGKAMVCNHLEQLFETPGVVVGMADVARAALKHYRHGKADFADYLILAEGRAAGAKHMASFDETLAGEQPGVRHPKTWVKS